MVISSNDGASQYQGEALGQFEYHEDKGYYVQTSTEQSAEKFEALYLYRDEDDGKWWVNPGPGVKTGWLRNPRSSQTLPTSGWQYWKIGGWYDDPTLTVTPGPLPPLPRQLNVTAGEAATKRCPLCLGVFTKTDRWWLGRPVYVNIKGLLLHHGAGDYGWGIAEQLGYFALTGSRGHLSPTEEESWRYWTGEWNTASVSVTGSD